MDYSISSSPEFDYLDLSITNEPEAGYQINKELNLAHRLVEETGVNLFLTGKAGTGKTTFLRRLRDTTNKRMIVLAPTGVAAINAGGSTIHSFFQLPFAPYIPGKGFPVKDRKHNFNREKKRIISGLDLLVIDEISMVRPDVLDAMDEVLRRYRNPRLPFGGVQLLLIGDLRQLPPVLRPEEKEMLSPHYSSEYFFHSKALNNAGFITIELTNVYRQTDREFIDILNAVREGKVSPQLLAKLNSRVIRDFTPAPGEKFIRLTTHNYMADRINEARLAAIPEPEFTYAASISGNFPESSYPAERLLRLKAGAQVMFIKNDTGADRAYYNGMLAEVVDLDEESIIVRSVEEGRIINVSKMEWEHTRYVVNESDMAVTQEVEGIFSQYPLRLAWAITIHKSQGLTFDRAIIDADSAFAAGQTYVALSRCRSLAGLVLGAPIPMNAVMTDSKLDGFIDSYSRIQPNQELLATFRECYFRQLLADLFDFNSFKSAFNDFYRYFLEYVAPIYPEYIESMREASDRTDRAITDVGNKFISLYTRPGIAPDDPSLLERIKAGCHYFVKELHAVDRAISSIDVTIHNAQYASALDNSFANLKFIISVKRRIMDMFCSLPFSPAEYIRVKAEALLSLYGLAPTNNIKRARKTKGGKTSKGNETQISKGKGKRPVGYSKHISLDLFKQGKSVAEVAEARGLTEGTVGGHLAEFAVAGEIALEEIISPEALSVMRDRYHGQTKKYSEAVEIFGVPVKPYEFIIFRDLYFASHDNK